MGLGWLGSGKSGWRSVFYWLIAVRVDGREAGNFWEVAREGEEWVVIVGDEEEGGMVIS